MTEQMTEYVPGEHMYIFLLLHVAKQDQYFILSSTAGTQSFPNE